MFAKYMSFEILALVILFAIILLFACFKNTDDFK